MKAGDLEPRRSRVSVEADAQDDSYRSVFFAAGQPQPENKFCHNKIRTALYVRGWVTPFIFIAKGVIREEFSKLPNAYFACIGILQYWGETSNTNGIPTVAPALMGVVVLSSVLKLLQDIERYRADSGLNNSKCMRLENGVFVKRKWVDLKVGDFLKVHNRESMPADVVLVSTYEPSPSMPVGACHVETKSLDGETNLKGRSVPRLFTLLCGGSLAEQTRMIASSTFRGKVKCEKPNAATTKFTGTVSVEGHEPAVLSINNVLLRGSSVRNTEYVIGMVINTGVDTKVMQGAREPPLKNSSIDRGINYLMVGVILTLIIMCVLSEILKQTLHEALGNHWYLHEIVGTVSPLKPFVVGVLRFVVLLAGFVSVSLYVSVDFNKSWYKKIMQDDPAMYHKASNTSLKVRTMGLIDELGCISHVFSDKTGTLTQNVMQFRKCSINGISYGHGNTEIGLARLARLGQLPTPALASGQGTGGREGEASGEASGPVSFDGPELFAALRGDAGAEQRDKCLDFLLLLALCHTVVIESVDLPGGGKEKKLSASSPDEAALVSAAAFFGIEFIHRQHAMVTLKDSFTGSQPQFEVLEVLDFTSARKRMSVVVREPTSGRIRLLSKGADSVMLPLLTRDQGDVLRRTEQHLEDHANDGLRTLLLTQKVLDPKRYSEWSKRYRTALVDVAELDKKERELPNEIERLMGEIEVGMELVGSTAIEDKLQQGVPTVIADMGRAGIAVWVLTGDKEETAINIAFACELFDTRTNILVLNLKTHPTEKEVEHELRKSGKIAAAASAVGDKHALVIDGEVISVVMRDPQLQLALLELTLHCQSVVACRCAPSQKAQLVYLVKKNVKGSRTLSIGDGANDVAMIQAAHVGVGISGQEGMQAANSADFSIAQFRFLSEMLFVHGRNMHRRVATLVLFIFYKNILMTLVTYMFLFYSAASGQRLYIEIGVQMYNVLYTLVPILIYSLIDRDVSDETARKLPQLYHLGVRNTYFSVGVIARWGVESFLESVIMFFVIASSMQKLIPTIPGMGDQQATGNDPDVIMLGDTCYAAVLVVITFKLVMESYQTTALQVFASFLCLALWWISDLVASYIEAGDMFYSWVQGMTGRFLVSQLNPAYWLLLVLVPAGALLPQFFARVWLRSFYPEFRDLVIEAEYHGKAEELKMLERWSIPLTQRRLPLRKDAPRTIEEQTCLTRLMLLAKGRTSRSPPRAKSSTKRGVVGSTNVRPN